MLATRRLPDRAKAERARDRAGVPTTDPGIDASLRAAVEWLGRAQDSSASRDCGVARHYSLISGWGPSYPETTGYIVPTLLTCAGELNDPSLRERAQRMLDWLVSIQLQGGGFQGGVIGARPVVPVTFNTGQILIGLSAGARELGDRYRPALNAAASWLVATQDSDGCWRSHPTPFAQPGVKAYETHAAWGLLEAARVEGNANYGEAALRNVAWALTRQQPNGWFADNCLTDAARPLTHTIGYALRGVLEAYRFARDPRLLDAATRTADGVLSALRDDGFLPGRLDADWRGAVDWSCLAGSAQIAHCWMLIHEATADGRYRDAAYLVNAYVRRTVRIDGPPDTRGAVKGSFPVWGEYGGYEYLNWACKFFIDSNLVERSYRSASSGRLGFFGLYSLAQIGLIS